MKIIIFILVLPVTILLLILAAAWKGLIFAWEEFSREYDKELSRSHDKK